MKWNLDRPLAVVDLETTGISPGADRIVEIAVLKIMPDGSRPLRVWRVNPGIPIPPEVTAIHGIADGDVADCPTFAEIARDVDEWLADCDLCGYNAIRFDIPMFVEEFMRAGIVFDVDGRRMVDAQRIYHRHEPRDLTAALSFYCGETHDNAHGAEADVQATIKVLESQIERYDDLSFDIGELDSYCNPKKPHWVDRQGRLKWANGEIALNFGKKKGTPLKALIKNDPGFIKWILRSDFPRDTKNIVEDAVRGVWPDPPASDD